MRLALALLVLLLSTTTPLPCQRISLLTHNAVVWSDSQMIPGMIDTAFARSGTLFVNGTPIPFQVEPQKTSFTVSVTLSRGTSTIVAMAESSGTASYSDTVYFGLGYVPRPEVYAYATITSGTLRLHASVLENPDSLPLTFTWSADTSNPAPLSLTGIHDTVASTLLSTHAPPGEYYFSLVTTTSAGDSIRSRTFVTVEADSIAPYQIGVTHARWIDHAILYEISPYFFVENGTFRDIIEKIPDFLDLGITTIWLQPVMETVEPYQGYHTTDYFALRNDLGTESDFRELIATAHANGLKVILDIVPNHTSIQHPYAVDAITYGRQSHYFGFYNPGGSTGPGSPVTVGNMTFFVYYWPTLTNLNFDSPEARRMIIEAGRYWVEKYDIDGYRVDVAWGMNERNPDFTRTWCQTLKRMKPELLLLAEDAASNSINFEGRFDAAYDWGGIGRWYWSGGLDPLGFRKVLNNQGRGYHPRALILRFMENNDMDRSVISLGPIGAKMTAVLTMAVNGLPMLYNGQEVGATAHPYTGTPVFSRRVPIKASDYIGMYPFYKHLLEIRRKYPSLSSRNYEELGVRQAPMVYAFHRWLGDEHIFGAVNFGGSADTAIVLLPVSRLGLDSTKIYYLTDLVSGKSAAFSYNELDSVAMPLTSLATQLWYLSDHPVAVAVEEPVTDEEPATWGLEQCYPNPFNPSTTIAYSVGQGKDYGTVGGGDYGRNVLVQLIVYDILGREVKTLVNEMQKPGHYQVRFDGAGLSSGVYFYQLRATGHVLTRKMLLLK